jgi:cell wall-associated NlpC family hydrolase
VPTRADIVQCARSQLGVRWHHQQRLKGEACDCVGLVAIVASELFGMSPEIPAYGTTPHDHMLERICDRYLKRNFGSIRSGDVLIMAWATEPHHMGIASDLPSGELGIIHSYAQVKKVVEHRFDEQWRARLRAVYSFPGLD